MTRRNRTDRPLPGLSNRRPGAVARVRRGIETQLRVQRAGGQLEQVDAGLVALARTLADNIDAENIDPDGSRFTISTLSGRLVAVILELRGERAGAGDTLDAELVALIDALRNTPGS